ncbi:MAG: RNA polymerase sigma factor [Clostridiaceae bacterium]|nr:RNA polymerase sigma factor [Clostridiaceae bacterium]
MQEQEIIEGLKNRNNEIFLQLVDSYKKKIISLCYSYTNDYHEAEDLSQEVFITLYNSISRFREECSLSTFIYRITVSRCLDYKRKRSIKGFLTGLLNIYREDTIDHDNKNYITDSINNLTEELKVPIVLYYYIGLSQSEIGNVLKISAKAVEGRIYRGKKKLKIEFEKEGYLSCRNKEMI